MFRPWNPSGNLRRFPADLIVARIGASEAVLRTPTVEIDTCSPVYTSFWSGLEVMPPEAAGEQAAEGMPVV